MSASALATKTANIERVAAPVGGQIAAPTTVLSGVPITPVQSANADIALEATIRDPREAFLAHTFVDSGGDLYDIREGDVAVIDSVRYAVRSVSEFNRPTSGSYSRLVLQARKVS